jgi:PKD repeat protein
MPDRKLFIVSLLLCSGCLIAGAIGCGPVAPEAQFAANSTSGTIPMAVWFTDLSTGDIETWNWDFDNDGVTDSTEQHALHVYESPGNYTVSLTIEGDGGTDIEVKSSYILVSPPTCKADFSAEPLECHGVTQVQFTDLSTGGVTGWAWDMNSDGSIDSTAQNPVYTYSRDGFYSVTLTITSAYCSDTITKQDYIIVAGCSSG